MIGAIAQHYVAAGGSTTPPVFQSVGSAGTSGVLSPIAINYPTVKTAGHLVVACLGLKPETVTPTDLASPWTSWVTKTGGTGAAGADSGPTRACIATKVLTGSEGASESVTLSAAPNPANARMVRYSGVDSSGIATTSGDDSTNGTGVDAVTVVMGSDPGFQTGDMVVAVFTAPTDSGTVSNADLTIPGCTVAVGNFRVTQATNAGNDANLIVVDFEVTAGSSSGAATFTMDIATTTQLGAGPVILVRLRGL